jgi:AcrR family transcriptional regulator
LKNSDKPLSQRLQRLVQSLESLFLEQGFLHLSTEELAKSLRCSKRSLYLLAPSREALFELVIERFLSRIRVDGAATARQAKDWTSAITGYLNAGVRGTRLAGAQFVRDLNTFGPGLSRLRDHQRMRVEGLEKIVARGAEQGAFTNLHPKLVAEVLLNAGARMSDPDFLSSAEMSMSQAYEELFRLVSYGLIPREKSPQVRQSRSVTPQD